MPTPSKKSAKKERKVKTVTPVAVFDISELDKILNSLGMLINMENETPQTRVNIKANARKLQADLRGYRRRATEYYKLAD
ncbi:hypothetical protein GCM10007423_39920 [Dyadobacter endophyticus]|uniref:Uncharacterized protein n=1 Tax=Dyadobacter endophyticus TaxID=1749036 RepID=A0ABQ1YZW2_9BACT|nr:hypothetical protein [Dyadobacter endophyticus]GGH42928.1 hypothetical protein GCM10007423_39920 [Dyadobacter endophyticus]